MSTLLYVYTSISCRYVGRLNLSEVYLAGVGDALSTHSGAEAKGIKAHFRMDESGLLLLDYVESLFEYPPDEEEQSTFASEREGGEGKGDKMKHNCSSESYTYSSCVSLDVGGCKCH